MELSESRITRIRLVLCEISRETQMEEKNRKIAEEVGFAWSNIVAFLTVSAGNGRDNHEKCATSIQLSKIMSA